MLWIVTYLKQDQVWNSFCVGIPQKDWEISVEVIKEVFPGENSEEVGRWDRGW